MSTNYYGRPVNQFPVTITINSPAEIAAAHEVLKSLEPIHLGKISKGWNYLANWNGGELYQTKREYLDFCSCLEIEDEYGRPVTFEEFQSLIENWRGRSNLESYANSFDYLLSRFHEVDGLEFLDGEWS